jgi:peroxiredoxin
MGLKSRLPTLRRGVMYLFVLLAGYAVGMTAFAQHNHSAVEAATSEPAPDLLLNKLSGNKIHLNEYKGKWVFLNFWATWCPPCLQEMPEMEMFYQQFKKKNMVMLAVSVDKDSPSTIASFIKDHGYTFDVFLDPDGESLSKFGISTIPATFIINPKGEIVSQANGPRSWMDKEIIKYFNDLMKKG